MALKSHLNRIWNRKQKKRMFPNPLPSASICYTWTITLPQYLFWFLHQACLCQNTFDLRVSGTFLIVILSFSCKNIEDVWISCTSPLISEDLPRGFWNLMMKIIKFPWQGNRVSLGRNDESTPEATILHSIICHITSKLEKAIHFLNTNASTHHYI